MAAKHITASVDSLPAPTAEQARHFTRSMGWEGRLYVEQMTSRASRGTLVYDFMTMAGYVLGRDALEKPLLDNLSVVVTTIKPETLSAWLRNAVEDVALADALDARLAACKTKREKMVAVRRLVYARVQQYRRALSTKDAGDEQTKAPAETALSDGLEAGTAQ